VMPIESLSFMPAGVIDDEQSAFGFQRGYLFGQVIEEILKDIGIDSGKRRIDGTERGNVQRHRQMAELQRMAVTAALGESRSGLHRASRFQACFRDNSIISAASCVLFWAAERFIMKTSATSGTRERGKDGEGIEIGERAGLLLAQVIQ
jgi:hypothetical protein